MIKKIISLLRRIVGGKVMKVVYNITLIFMALLAVYALDIISDIVDPTKGPEIIALLSHNPYIWIMLVLPIVFMVTSIVFMQYIDKWQDDKADKRHKELLVAIRSLRRKYGSQRQPNL